MDSHRDAAGLVRAAESAIVDENGQPEQTRYGRIVEVRVPDTAEVVTVAVLRALAGPEGPAGASGYGRSWSPDGLRRLADRIEKGPADV